MHIQCYLLKIASTSRMLSTEDSKHIECCLLKIARSHRMLVGKDSINYMEWCVVTTEDSKHKGLIKISKCLFFFFFFFKHRAAIYSKLTCLRLFLHKHRISCMQVVKSMYDKRYRCRKINRTGQTDHDCADLKYIAKIHESKLVTVSAQRYWSLPTNDCGRT